MLGNVRYFNDITVTHEDEDVSARATDFISGRQPSFQQYNAGIVSP